MCWNNTTCCKNILKFINKVEKLNLNVDLLIIDDNSPDQTSKIITNYSKNKNYIKLIVRKNKQGLDTAHKLAYKFALKNNYQNLITMDADLSHNPKEIPKILEQLNNYKFVIGSRYIKGGRCQKDTVLILMVRFALLLKIISMN